MAGGMFVYVSNADSKDILVFELDLASGALTPVQDLQLDVPGQVMPMTVSPDQRFLYVAQRSEPYSVLTFAVDALSGRLTQLGEAPLQHSTPYITTDRTGRWLLSASYQGNLVSVSPIGPQGFVQAPHQVIRTQPAAHSVQVDAANRHAFVPCLGGDVVLQWRFDAVSGKLSPNQPDAVRVSEGAGPRHFAFHPDGRHLYLLNELAASVYVYDYDVLAGTLSERQVTTALPPWFDGPPLGEKNISTNGGPKAADIHVTPDGRFLYASERTTSTIAAFRIDPHSGRLETIASIETEEKPRGLRIDPFGRYLLAVGQFSHHLSVYAIDQVTGQLERRQRYRMGEAPNWIEILRLA